MQISEPVSGQRFKCANCEDWLSFKDLEFCELTAKALTQFSSEISPQRHEAEVREDKSMVLLPAVKSRSEREKARRKKKKTNGNAASNAGIPSREPETIVIDD